MIWTTGNLAFRAGTIKTILSPDVVGHQARIIWLIGMADRSMVTTNPLNNTNVRGYMDNDDIIVVSKDALYWFDVTESGNWSTNGGGGLLRGIWPLALDGSQNYNFSRIENGYNYAPSILYPGSVPGAQGSGLSVLGNYNTDVDDGRTWAIEHTSIGYATSATGLDAGGGDVFVQFAGDIAYSPGEQLPAGITSYTDSDTRAAVVGYTKYVLTYRISQDGITFRQEVSITPNYNKFGALGTFVVSLGIAGFDGEDVVWHFNGTTKDQDWLPVHSTVKYKNITTGYAGIEVDGLLFEATVVSKTNFPSGCVLQVIDNRGIGNFRVNALDFKTPAFTTTNGTNLYIIIDYEITVQ